MEYPQKLSNNKLLGGTPCDKTTQLIYLINYKYNNYNLISRERRSAI